MWQQLHAPSIICCERYIGGIFVIDNPHHISNMPKGRSKELIDRRNRDLYKDYRCLMDVKKLRYSAIITMLSEKYYISEFTVLDVLRSRIKEEDEPKESKKEFTGFRVSRWKSREQSSRDPQGELFCEG